MDAYDAQLEKVANALQLLPRKLSEENVRLLGNINHFETFEEDDIDKSKSSKRLSLSGSIVVLDLDFVGTDKVEKASVSLSRETANNSRFSAMSPANDPSGQLLKSLREPRLDAFSQMLSFLSRCDRFSTKNVDCFRSLDLISEAIHWYVQRTETTEFGKLVVNPPNRLGLGFKYNDLYSGPWFAYLDIVPGSRNEYCLRNFTTIDDWLDTESVQWKADLPHPEYEARAELVVTLDPPVVMSEMLANELNAMVKSRRPPLDERKRSASYTVRRHPRFASKETPSDDFDVIVGNMLPFQLVEVKQIPVRGPAQLPQIFTRLRQFGWLYSLVESVLDGPEPVWTNEATDMNIADALGLKDQPIHRKRIPLSVSLRAIDDNIMIDVSCVISEFQMTVTLSNSGFPPSVQFSPKIPPHLNIADLERLLARGNLALAISYALSSIGKLRRRSTATSISG